MRALFAFIKKDWLEQYRSGKIMLLGILFVLLGVMNPAAAKLTPWLLEVMADSLEGSGLTVTSVSISALDSWVQFYKNMPMGLLVFILLESSIFTKESQSGTLIPILTKGLNRYKVIISKAVLLLLLWSAYYWLSYVITYGYTAYFWDNRVVCNLIFSSFCLWLLGVWVITLTVFFSVLANSNTGVLLGCGGTFLAVYLIGLFPNLKEYSPSLLLSGNALIYGIKAPETYTAAIIITIILSAVCIAVSIPILKRKKI